MNSDLFEQQLKLLGISSNGMEVLQDKAGITVARVCTPEGLRVLKCFEDMPSRREISNYRLLGELGIPTLRIFAATEAALLMEDMSSGGEYRMAAEADMADVQVAERLAGWYRRLHDKGFEYVKNCGSSMYSETDLFSMQNIENVMARSGTGSLPVWKLVMDNYKAIRNAIVNTPMTLTYNDFYYTNMAVARDGSSAIMFDYNLLGRGHVYSDMRNVCSSLSDEAGEAFRLAYGEHDMLIEKLIDDAVSPVVTLHLAYQRSVFPSWAGETLNDINGGYSEAIERLLAQL